MEFVYGDVNMEALVCMPCAQAQVEGELPLPEGRRAADAEVLSANGTVTVTKCASAEGAVVIEGRVRAELVCRDSSFVPEEGGNAAGAVFAFNSSAAFRYVLEAPGAKEGMGANAQASIVEMNVAQGARLSFSSTVELCAVVTCEKPIRALNDVAGAQAEFKTNAYSSQNETLIGCEETRVREELAARGVCRVLCAYAEVSSRSVRAGGDTALVDATAYVTALVENESGRIETYASQLPLTLEVGLDERARGDVYADAAALATELYALSESTLCLELNLRTKIYDVCPREAQLSADAYLPGEAMESAFGETELMLRGGHVGTRCSMDEKLVLPEGMPQPTRVVWSAARPLVTSAAAEDGMLAVEGVASVRAVYEDANNALNAFTTQLPFACGVPCPAWCNEARAGAKLLCAGMTLSGASLVFSAALEISAMPFAAKTVRYVAGFEPCAAREGRRSLILCYAGAGETLFDIGRRYGLSRASLLAANPNAREQLAEGERLVFIGRG
ncbi:MAG TPA: SPOCS domain-containing protein [Clostridia bacterium]|nr:SPOCS domain-containing protein [Clostridia bacterium]